MSFHNWILTSQRCTLVNQSNLLSRQDYISSNGATQYDLLAKLCGNIWCCLRHHHYWFDVFQETMLCYTYWLIDIRTLKRAVHSNSCKDTMYASLTTARALDRNCSWANTISHIQQHLASNIFLTCASTFLLLILPCNIYQFVQPWIPFVYVGGIFLSP